MLRHALLGVVTASLSMPASAQPQLSDANRELGRRILGGLHWVLDSIYYDSTYGGQSQAELWWRGEQGIDGAANVGQMFAAIAQSLQLLNDSHTWFIPPVLTIEADYGWRWIVVGEDCYVTDSERDAEREGLRPGDLVHAINGIAATRANLPFIEYAFRDLAPQERMRLDVTHLDGQREEIVFEARIRRLPPFNDITDVETRRRLEYEAYRAVRVEHRWQTFDSVSVWRMSAFGYRDRDIDRNMRRARDRPWLILDYRGNGGGAIEGITRLLGHFVDSTFVAFRQEWRDSTTAHEVTPHDEQFRGRVIILLDSQSASSAEITAYVLRQERGATIIGDVSAGMVRGSHLVPLAVQTGFGRYVFFGMSVTVFDIVMSDGVRLERLGIVPTEMVLPTGADIAGERDPVMERALALTGITVTAREAARVAR